MNFVCVHAQNNHLLNNLTIARPLQRTSATMRPIILILEIWKFGLEQKRDVCVGRILRHPKIYGPIVSIQ